MTTEKLFEFSILAQTLNFSRAAQKLFISQSVLSRHIAELEKELGVSLLDRSTRSVKLTEAGRILTRYADTITQKSDLALSRLRMTGIEATGGISIVCPDGVSSGHFMAFIKRFTSKYPEIDLKLNITAGEERPEALEGCDLFFSSIEYPGVSGRQMAITAFTEPAYLALPENHRLMFGHKAGLQELAGETLFVPYSNEIFCSYSTNWQLSEKLTGNQITVVRVPTVATALFMVELGRGVTIIPQHILRSSYTAVKIVIISTPGCHFETYAYWNRWHDNPAAKLFFEELGSFRHAYDDIPAPSPAAGKQREIFPDKF